MFRMIPCDCGDEWTSVVKKTIFWDFYHLPFYHAMAKSLGHGEPYLCVFERDEFVIALPILIRPIQDLLRGPLEHQAWSDATSVYGYAGPITSHALIPMEILRDFQASLAGALREKGVVSLFCRLHPLFEQSALLSGLGVMVRQGQTVSIDLTIDQEARWKQYRSNHLRQIQKLKTLGATCLVDESLQQLSSFLEVYNETMSRVNATTEYRFPLSYFKQFAETKDAKVVLILCYIHDNMAAGGIFVKCENIMEYHLGGTAASMLNLAPMKMVFDGACQWGRASGATALHLGGGVGSREDSLFHFKKGFSNRSHPFYTWRWVVLPSVYEQLRMIYEQRRTSEGYGPRKSHFFPDYRSPLEQ